MKRSVTNSSTAAFFVQFGSHSLILASLAAGFCLAWSAASGPSLGSLESDSPANADFGGLPPASQSTAHIDDQSAADSASQFIQEPLTRSAFRPNYKFDDELRRGNQRSNPLMLRAFSEAIADARLSTVRLMNSVGDRIALGAVVDSEGWIVTKASQLPASGSITAKLADNSEFVVEIVQHILDVDLALLRIERTGLIPVPWAQSSVPQRGSWLATTDVGKTPSAVGVVSAGIQSVHSARPVLGVELHDSASGTLIKRVLYGTGADLAGLRVGDVIAAVNGTNIATQKAFHKAIGPTRGGEVVKLTVNRGERMIESEVRLMDLADELLDETEMEVNGPVSARATGFDRVFLHDTVLDPSQCGGPLCNLDGKVVGLNIARAGRVSSYALPVDVVRPLLEGIIAQAKLVSRPVNSTVAAEVR